MKWRQNMQHLPKPYEIYRHFKGMHYQVLSIATHSETGEKMVVYQQMYAPFGVYVRPLEMFMSKVDKEKYPQVQQEYRFERLQAPAWELHTMHEIKQETVLEQQSCAYEKQEEVVKKQESEQESQEMTLDPGLLKFLEADTYQEKLEILNMLHPRITDSMIDTMAACLEIEVKSGDIEKRYSELLNCLLTMERYECNRLR